MPHDETATDFREALIGACIASIGRAHVVVGDERIYAFAVYTTEDFAGFSCAMSTEESFARRPKHPAGLDPETLEMLKEHPDLLAKIDLTEDISDYLRVTADEWEYIGNDNHAFDRVNALAEKIHKINEHREWAVTKSIFMEQALLALKHVRACQPFAIPTFTSDVLLTLQWRDIGTDEPELLSIATTLNTTQWTSTLQREWGGTK